MDGIGLLPLIGALKNTDEALDLIKGALKNSDVAKNGDELLAGVVKTLKPQNLMDELANSGVKYSADDVVMVAKTPDGKLVWLENGNSLAGLKHIVDEHASHFAKRGVNDIPGFLSKVLQETPVRIDINKAGPYSEYLIDGKMYTVAYGTNGYVVSFYPSGY